MLLPLTSSVSGMHLKTKEQMCGIQPHMRPFLTVKQGINTINSKHLIAKIGLSKCEWIKCHNLVPKKNPTQTFVLSSL